MRGKELAEGIMKIIPCTEATFLISKRQETVLTMRERFNLVVHLFLCKFCRRFFEQTKLVLMTMASLSSGESLTRAEKQKLQESLRLH
jgi:hypothetical protein